MENNKEMNVLTQLTQMQTEYYENNSKHTLFKRAQKMDCAASISNNCNIEQLVQHTVYIIPNTNRVYLDYTIFKMYASPQTYLPVAKEIIYLFEKCMAEYGNYSVHINLSSLTISGCERHKSILSLLVNQSVNTGKEYAELLNTCHIYNPPNAMDAVLRMSSPFMNPNIKNKIILHSKTDSEQLIHTLFQN